MSVVTGVTLQCKENCYSNEDNIQKINDWLKLRNFAPLEPVSKFYGGSKGPQVDVYGCGYNYFPEDEFADFVFSLQWDMEENLVLLMNPEEGGTRIFRFDGLLKVEL